VESNGKIIKQKVRKIPMVPNRIKGMLQQRKQRMVERKNEVLLPREFNTPNRECWNTPIHQILKAIDNHTRLHLETGNFWHEEQAQILRTYVKELNSFYTQRRGVE